MPRVFCLINHELTPRQVDELYTSFKAESNIFPPAPIASLWKDIPVVEEFTLAMFDPIIDWLQDANPGDVLVIQGEFGATFTIVDFALQNGLIPVSAVTKRIVQETREGEKVVKNNFFEHICFRKYSYYKDLST